MENRSGKNYIVVESSHLFRAGEQFGTQFFVSDVAGFLRKNLLEDEPAHCVVLFGSTKEEQAARYIGSLTRDGIEVIRMNPLGSRFEETKKFYKPSLYLHKLFHEFPLGSRVILVGFHNLRFEEILLKYRESHEIHVVAFSTHMSSGESMHIPEHWGSLCASCVSLDAHADKIKEEFFKTKRVRDSKVDK